MVEKFEQVFMPIKDIAPTQSANTADLKTDERQKLQRKLLKSFKNNDQIAIKRIKGEYIKRFPEQIESVEVLFALPEFLQKSKQMAQEKQEGESDLPYEQLKNAFRDLTEYQFLFTHFLISAGDDSEYLKNFWDIAQSIASSLGCQQELVSLQRGQISQVAVQKIMQKLNMNPRLSHPSEDAFAAIDLWTSDNKAIQIAGWKEEEPMFIESETFGFPATQTEIAQGKRFQVFSYEKIKQKALRFFAKTKRYAAREHLDIRSFMMVVPYSRINPINGEPSDELVEFFRVELNKTIARSK